MCKDWSVIQNLNKSKGDPAKWELRMLEARRHLKFVICLYREQEAEGRYWLHEHPQGAASWQEPAMVELLAYGHSYVVNSNMCQFGMTTHVDEKNGEQGLVKKPTGFLTSSQCIAQALNLQCAGGHQHVHLVGGRAAGAQVYPEKLCKAIVNGMMKQKEIVMSDRVDTGTMNKGN